MASFQAKTGWDSLRKRKKKLSFRSVIIQPVIENSKKIAKKLKFQKNSEKIQKIKKHHYGFFSSQNGMGLAEKEEKKLLFRSVTTRPGIENSKKTSKKILKIKKHHHVFISSQTGSGVAEKE